MNRLCADCSDLADAVKARDDLQIRYDVACEFIANHLQRGNTDRARCMVEREVRMREGRAPGRAR